MIEIIFNEQNLSIDIKDVYRENGVYRIVHQIDLEEMTNGVKLLHVIFQMNDKPWCTPALLKDLFQAIDDACENVFNMSAQVVFSPLGKINNIDWKARQINGS